jgi:transcription termination factor Rho
MAIKPSPDRSDLESKTREDLQTIAKVKGVDTPTRATKAALIEAIMGDTPSSSDSSVATATSETPGSRAVRSRRTVATPEDDFEELLGEFVAEPKSETRTETVPAAEPALTESVAPSERTSARQFTQTRPERQPREFTNDSNNRSRRNRRNRNGRERFTGDSMPNADQPYAGELVEVEGLLDLRDDGYGFLRTKGYHASPNDVYVSINQVRRYHLRKGDTIAGGYRPAASNEKYPALLRVDTVAGVDPEVARLRPKFEDLTPLFPDEKLNLETNEGKLDLTPRIVDLLAPIGKGQRGLIVSPPKAGKTTIMKQIAQSIETNNPEVHLMVLLVDERPEEVTDIRRSVHGEVISSTFDRPAEEHTHVAELCIERAKRLVEQGRDVVIILDGITRLARAYNLAAPATGRIMSGGVDSGALYPPKKFFGAARNIEEGGSLTILASALVETGSKMDEVIFEEFKGTGNMELRLDRRLAERRLYPAIDVNGSSTRHEELLFGRDALQQVWKLRRVLNGLAAEGRDAAGLELLIDKLKSTKSNDEFLAEIGRGPAPTS